MGLCSSRTVRSCLVVISLISSSVIVLLLLRICSTRSISWPRNHILCMASEALGSNVTNWDAKTMSIQTRSASSVTRGVTTCSQVLSTCSSTSERVRLAHPAAALRTVISTTLVFLLVLATVLPKSSCISCSGRGAPFVVAEQVIRRRFILCLCEFSMQAPGRRWSSPVVDSQTGIPQKSRVS